MQRTLLIASFGLLSILLGYVLWSWQSSLAPPQGHKPTQSATVLTEPRPLPDFSLTDQDGQTFGPGQLRERWNLLFFGFTRCPDICPNTLGLLHAVNQALQQDGSPAPLQVVFISVDPEHDKPQALKQYIEYFDASFLAATGPEPELQALTSALYMPYAHVPVGTSGDYTVEHSGALVLLNPQAQVIAYFSPPLQVGPIVSDLRNLIRG